MTAPQETPRIDFSNWKRDTLEDFANECYANKLALEEDLRTAVDAYRALLLKGEKDGKQ